MYYPTFKTNRLLLVSEEICKNDVQTPTKLCSGTSQDKTEKNKRLYQHGEFNNKKIKNMQGNIYCKVTLINDFMFEHFLNLIYYF